MNSANQPINIPTLTEIISRENDNELITPEQGVATASEHKEVSPPVAAGFIQEPSFDELEKTLQETVLRQLLTRIDFVLEHRVRDSLAEVVQSATTELTKEIRQGLTKTLTELVHRTINQELSKIQSLTRQAREPKIGEESSKN